MPFSFINHQGIQVLKLEGVVTICHAQDLGARLGEDFEEGVPITVNTAQLLDIDTCVLQLLCSLRKTCPGLTLPDPSDAFIAAVDRCGLRRGVFGVREGV